MQIYYYIISNKEVISTASILVDKDGVEFVFTTVVLPKTTRDEAKKAKIPLSGTLRSALDKELAKRRVEAENATNTKASISLPTTDERRGK